MKLTIADIILFVLAIGYVAYAIYFICTLKRTNNNAIKNVAINKQMKEVLREIREMYEYQKESEYNAQFDLLLDKVHAVIQLAEHINQREIDFNIGNPVKHPMSNFLDFEALSLLYSFQNSVENPPKDYMELYEAIAEFLDRENR